MAAFRSLVVLSIVATLSLAQDSSSEIPNCKTMGEIPCEATYTTTTIDRATTESTTLDPSTSTETFTVTSTNTESVTETDTETFTETTTPSTTITTTSTCTPSTIYDKLKRAEPSTDPAVCFVTTRVVTVYPSSSKTLISTTLSPSGSAAPRHGSQGASRTSASSVGSRRASISLSPFPNGPTTTLGSSTNRPFSQSTIPRNGTFSLKPSVIVANSTTIVLSTSSSTVTASEVGTAPATSSTYDDTSSPFSVSQTGLPRSGTFLTTDSSTSASSAAVSSTSEEPSSTLTSSGETSISSSASSSGSETPTSGSEPSESEAATSTSASPTSEDPGFTNESSSSETSSSDSSSSSTATPSSATPSSTSELSTTSSHSTSSTTESSYSSETSASSSETSSSATTSIIVSSTTEPPSSETTVDFTTSETASPNSESASEAPTTSTESSTAASESSTSSSESATSTESETSSTSSEEPTTSAPCRCSRVYTDVNEVTEASTVTPKPVYEEAETTTTATETTTFTETASTTTTETALTATETDQADDVAISTYSGNETLWGSDVYYKYPNTDLYGYDAYSGDCDRTGCVQTDINCFQCNNWHDCMDTCSTSNRYNSQYQGQANWCVGVAYTPNGIGDRPPGFWLKYQVTDGSDGNCGVENYYYVDSSRLVVNGAAPIP